MQVSKVTLNVFNPRAEFESIPQVSVSPRLDKLTGKRIGILSNGKAGGEMLLPYLEEALKKRIPDIELRMWRVGFARLPDAKEPILKEIAEYADGVIALMGD